jgi:hypothetical protein
MADVIRNERVKLTATWLNNTAVAVMSLGVLTPIFLSTFRTNDAAMADGMTTGKGILICIALSVFLTFVGATHASEDGSHPMRGSRP